ncbi:MAG: hypothetical protein ACR5K4_01295 [Sodalis sp. (in: enterobacteria)]
MKNVPEEIENVLADIKKMLSYIWTWFNLSPKAELDGDFDKLPKRGGNFGVII